MLDDLVVLKVEKREVESQVRSIKYADASGAALAIPLSGVGGCQRASTDHAGEECADTCCVQRCWVVNMTSSTPHSDDSTLIASTACSNAASKAALFMSDVDA